MREYFDAAGNPQLTPAPFAHSIATASACEKATAFSPSSGLAGSIFGQTSEEYYCKRDDFTRYITQEVNPARINAGLEPLDMKTAEECFRILNDFARKWIQSNSDSLNHIQ